jgi:hypothetical protein
MPKFAVLVALLAFAPSLGAQQAPESRQISGGVLAGMAVERPQPSYPKMARAAGIEGAVVVEVTVDEAGRVVAARAVSGHPLLRDGMMGTGRLRGEACGGSAYLWWWISW